MKLICEIHDDRSVLVQFDYGDKKRNKTITINDFIKCVQGSVMRSLDDNDRIKYISPLYYSKGNTKLLQVKEYEGGKIVYFVQFSPKRMPILLYDRFYDDVGLPNTIFAISTVNGVFSSGGKIVCAKDEVITNDSEIYYYPFSNASDNHICIGSNKINFTINEQTVLDVPGLFFTMPNTKCSFHPKYNSASLAYSEMLEKLSYKDFDDSLLVKDENKIYKDFVEGM